MRLVSNRNYRRFWFAHNYEIRKKNLHNIKVDANNLKKFFKVKIYLVDNISKIMVLINEIDNDFLPLEIHSELSNLETIY